MTTKFLDNKNLHFHQNFIVMALPTKNEKQRFWTILLSTPVPNPPEKRKFYFYCRLAVSD